MCDYEYFLITVLFLKTKEMSLKKFPFYCVNFSQFSLENLMRLLKNTSKRALFHAYGTFICPSPFLLFEEIFRSSRTFSSSQNLSICLVIFPMLMKYFHAYGTFPPFWNFSMFMEILHPCWKLYMIMEFFDPQIGMVMKLFLLMVFFHAY